MPTEFARPALMPVLRIAASSLIVAVTLADAAKSWSRWHNYLAVRDYLAGSTESVQATFVDRAGQFESWIMLAAAVAFVWWLWEARQRSQLLSIAQHEHGQGWVIGAWLCPVVNFWFPRRIVSDIWKASRQAGGPHRFDLERQPGSPLINWWWGFFVVYNLIDKLAIGVLFDQLDTVAVIATLSTVCKAAAAALIIAVMGQITRAQAHYRPLVIDAAT
jgi:Domain of unknown function (DUF4328)